MELISYFPLMLSQLVRSLRTFGIPLRNKIGFAAELNLCFSCVRVLCEHYVHCICGLCNQKSAAAEFPLISSDENKLRRR